MDHIVQAGGAMARGPHGPLGPHLGAFAEWATQQGYAVSTRRDQVRLAAGFSAWLGRHGIDLHHVGPHHVRRYLRGRARWCRGHVSDATVLRRVLDFLAETGVLPRRAPAPRGGVTPVEGCVQGFLRYLHEERGLTTQTTASYARWARRFLADRFAGTRVTLNRLTAEDVTGFVRRQAPHLHPREAKMLTTVLRSFLRYGWYRRLMTRELALAVPTVPWWSVTSIPRAIAADHVERLLRSMDRRTGPARRDYAIVLLLARLGLRAGEVAGLELEDIDWHTGRLCLRRKGGRTMELPLPREVGAAIAAYLRGGRPRSLDRRVFVRRRAPHRGLQSHAAITTIVRRALQRAGIDAPTMGAHQFRHGLATELLRRGASLTEIGDVLGHRSQDSTKVYAQVDVTTLRSVALPWPGGGR